MNTLGFDDALGITAANLQVGWRVWVSGEFRVIEQLERKDDGTIHLLFWGGKGHIARPEDTYALAPSQIELHYPDGRTQKMDAT